MEVKIRDIVEILVKEREKGKPRLATLEMVLNSFNIQYKIQKENDTTNVIIPKRDNSQYRVIGAHYDVWGTSKGINDNTVAVATLIKLAMLNTKRNVEIVFFDKEETGMLGSDLYIRRSKNASAISNALILDVIGFGDTLLFSGDIFTKNHYNRKFNYDSSYVLYNVLPSDNLVFDRHKIANTLLVAAPHSDLNFVEHEKRIKVAINRSAKFYESFHNRNLDNDISIINWELVDFIYNKLVELYDYE